MEALASHLEARASSPGFLILRLAARQKEDDRYE